MADPTTEASAGGESGAVETGLLGREAPPTPVDPYRPLSLLALAAFAVSFLYAVLVLVGGGISYAIHQPWLLSFWAVLLPLVGFTLSLVARQRIRDAEGTVSGEWLATTGLFLSVIVGLTYAAYFAATRFAVTRQATSFVENVWFDRLRNNEVDKAFLLTLTPPRPDENDPDLRDQLETLHNSTDDMVYTMFSQAPVVHAIRQGGPKTELTLEEVAAWGFEAGGYRVRLIYNLVAPQTTGKIQVVVQSHEGGTKDVRGRQWFVLRDGTGPISGSQLQPTALGQQVMVAASNGHAFAQGWINKLDFGPAAAFLDTLPVSERAQYRNAVEHLRMSQAGPAAAGLAFRLTEPASTQEFRKRLAEFRQGSMLVAEPPGFWCLEKDRKALLADMKNVFRREGENPTSIKLMQTMVPFWKEKGDRVVFDYEADLQSPRYKGEGVLVVSATLGSDGSSATNWRVESVELARGRKSRDQPPQTQQQMRPGAGAARPKRPVRR